MAMVARTIAQIEQSGDFGEVTGLCRAAAGEFGYDMFIVYAITPDADLDDDAIYWLDGDWFGSGEALDARTYLSRCPMNRHILHSDHPFFWSKRRASGGPEYQMVSETRGAGPHGLQVPIFGHSGLLGAVSFGGRSIVTTTEARIALVALAGALFHALRKLAGPSPANTSLELTRREREIISWVASGRRHGEVAQLLGLSARTVENHLRRVRRKLGVSSTAQAIYRLARTDALQG